MRDPHCCPTFLARGKPHKKRNLLSYIIGKTTQRCPGEIVKPMKYFFSLLDNFVKVPLFILQLFDKKIILGGFSVKCHYFRETIVIKVNTPLG